MKGHDHIHSIQAPMFQVLNTADWYPPVVTGYLDLLDTLFRIVRQHDFVGTRCD